MEKMKKMKIKLNKMAMSVCVFGVVTLSACSPGTAVKQLEAPAVNVSSKNVAAPQPRRLVNVPLEAKLKGKSVPANCRLDTPYYNASFTAPANLKLPDYGAQTPTVVVECSTASAKGSMTVAPVNVEEKNATAAGAALFGVVGALVAAGASKGNDSDHFYHRINVKLK